MSKKDVYYFSHDFNARNDPKCSALIHEYGPEGYGVFWMIIEIMAEQQDHKIKKFPKLFDGLARQFSIESGRLRSIIEALLQDYELLVQDDKYIWSDSLMRRMQEKDKSREAKIEAGRKGGLKSGISRNKSKIVEAKTKQNEALLEANEPEEKKLEEIIRKENDVVVTAEKFYNDNFGLITRFIAEDIKSFIDDGIEEPLIIRLMQEALKNNAQNWKYVSTAIVNQRNKNITTLEQYEASERGRSKTGKKVVGIADYSDIKM